MSQEIERKFLVKGEFKHLAGKTYRISQGYLSSVPERTVRIRIKGGKGFITIKGKSSESGLSRYEWEKEIPETEALELLLLCEPGIIDKIRYEVLYENQTFEVDEFFGENEGLILAELELQNEDIIISKPNWLGNEVTGDKRYYNTWLSSNPFENW